MTQQTALSISAVRKPRSPRGEQTLLARNGARAWPCLRHAARAGARSGAWGEGACAQQASTP